MIHVEEYKDPQHELASEKFLTPKKLYLALSQHIGQPSQAKVKMGDLVVQGQQIAGENGFISAKLHASGAGKVMGVDNWYHPVLRKASAITLQCQPEEKKYIERTDIDSLGKEKLIELIKDAGIIGMGGAAFPTHVKLKPPKKIDTLIINGCECEPYLSCDYRLMIENRQEIFKGIEIICRLINPKRVIFAIENNKPEAIKKINLLITTRKFNLPKATVAVLESVYPQGGEKQLVQSVTGRKIPPQSLPFDVGCLVHNVGTCFAIYEAVYYGKPLIERMVTFAGDALAAPKNLWVKIGTTLKELFDQKVLEFKHDPAKIISGGPMMGIALDGLDYPILKGTGGFLFLTENAKIVEQTPCLKCARCVDVCPMGLLPLELAKLIKQEEFNNLSDLNIVDCIECGCCAYTCPANIGIVHYIRLGKKYMPKEK